MGVCGSRVSSPHRFARSLRLSPIHGESELRVRLRGGGGARHLCPCDRRVGDREVVKQEEEPVLGLYACGLRVHRSCAELAEQEYLSRTHCMPAINVRESTTTSVTTTPSPGDTSRAIPSALLVGSTRMPMRLETRLA